MINLNGTLHLTSETYLAADNRGLHYGDAVFETMRFSGGKLYFWEDHYFRLMASMRMMRMEIPMTFAPEYLESEIQKTIDAEHSQQHAFRVKLLVWRTAGGKYTPKSRSVEYLIEIAQLEVPLYTIEEQDYEVELFKDHFVNAGVLSTLKSNNKLINILGSIYAEENDYQNCLLLNEQKQVVEALNGNIFLVQGYKIKTPPLTDGCLNGVLRKQIIAILGSLPDYILDESSVSPFELQKSDEIFVTNVIGGITPITKYRKKEFKDTVAKELLAKLNMKARLG